MSIREASSKHAPLLTALRRRSIGYWGYPEKWIEANLVQIRIPNDLVYSNQRMFVLEEADQILGFYNVERSKSTLVAKLIDLYIDIPFIGKGNGQYLWQDVVTRLQNHGDRKLIIISDPNAESFYLKQGAVRIREILSPTDPNLSLPELQFEL